MSARGSAAAGVTLPALAPTTMRGSTAGAVGATSGRHLAPAPGGAAPLRVVSGNVFGDGDDGDEEAQAGVGAASGRGRRRATRSRPGLEPTGERGGAPGPASAPALARTGARKHTPGRASAVSAPSERDRDGALHREPSLPALPGARPSAGTQRDHDVARLAAAPAPASWPLSTLPSPHAVRLPPPDRGAGDGLPSHGPAHPGHRRTSAARGDSSAGSTSGRLPPPVPPGAPALTGAEREALLAVDALRRQQNEHLETIILEERGAEAARERVLQATRGRRERRKLAQRHAQERKRASERIMRVAAENEVVIAKRLEQAGLLR